MKQSSTIEVRASTVLRFLRTAPRRRIWLSCVAVGLAVGIGGWSSGAFSQTSPVWTVFTAGKPAVAEEVNDNFTILKNGNDATKAALDTTRAGFDGLNAKLGPVTTNNGFYLGFNENQSLAAGVIVNGTSSASTSQLVFRVKNANGSSLNFDAEHIVNSAAPVWIQSGPFGAILGQPTIIGGNLQVKGSLTVDGEDSRRMVVTAPFITANTAGAANNCVQLDQTKFELLCGDVDGCNVTLIMKNFAVPAGQTGRSPSSGPHHLEYDSGSRSYQAESITGQNDAFGTDNVNTGPETVMQQVGHACALTDSAYTPNGGAQADTGPGVFLTTLNANGWTPDCVIVIDD